jgi:hypothetical protein
VFRTAQNPGRTAVGAWSLIVALLPAAMCRAGDGMATDPAASNPSSTTTASPARAKIPPPRAWSKLIASPAPESEPASQPAPTPASQPTPAPASQPAPAAVSSPAPAPAPESASSPTPAPSVASPQPGAPPSPGEPAPPKTAVASGLAPEAVAAPAPSKPADPNLADTLGVTVGTEQVQVDLASMKTKADAQVNQAGCATCGGYHSLGDGSELHEAIGIGCSGGSCIPGRQPCNLPANECNTIVGAFLQNLYQCVCCPDPCYQPQWVPAANASFFADYARPRTVTRLRYDNLEDMTRPDRNQFWIQGVTANPTNNKRPINNPHVRLQQFYIYQEAAGARGSFFIEYPYRQINQSYAPTQAGFSDLNFGIKSLMFDCELLQITFQFRTYTPTGNASLNLGTGHFSLDPSIMASLKLSPTTYFQGQWGNWIPLAGNQSLAGGMFYSLMSVNQVLCYPTPDSPLIGTLEMDVWSFENGGYTDAIKKGGTPAYVEKGGGVSYCNIGPGLRQSICNKIDFGAAITWATGQTHWAQPWFRFEARFLF